MTQDPKAPPCAECNRRQFLKEATGAAAALTMAAALPYGCGDDANLDDLTQDLPLALTEHPELAQRGQTKLIDAGLSCPIAVTRTADNDFVITGTECSHQNCCVGRNGDGWRCPCHGATFSFEGERLGGPAPVGLTRYGFSLDGDTLTILGKS